MQLRLRYIPDGSRSARFNMAADNLLLKKCSSNSDILLLRTYTWDVPTITIGMLQEPFSVLDMENITKNGIHWIRRPTGGRPVLHFDDCTYSCAFSHKNHLLGSTVKETYSILSRCLQTTLLRLNVHSQAHDSDLLFNELKRQQKLPCFLAPNRNEIMVDGKKLVGSAQRRTASSVLQHGSLPISDAYRELPEYLNISESERVFQKKLLQEKTIHLSSLDSTITFSALSKAIIGGFVETLAINHVEETWSSDELVEIEEEMSFLDFSLE
jgi:lipoate-protein ligase A